MKFPYKIFLICLIQLFIFSHLECCTRIFWNNNSKAKLVARTMDLFISDEPQIWMNPKGMEHQSVVDDNGLKWKSTFGSVVVSAFNVKDLVTDGMNEKGFAVHALALTTTQYEKRDNRPGVNYGEWLQYLLDTCQNVEEAIHAHAHFQVVPIAVNEFVWPLHLIIEDATGDSAIIEFVAGEMKVYHSSQYCVATTEPTYDQHLINFANFGTQALPTLVDSKSRFIRASAYLKELPEPKNAEEGISLLRNAITKLFQNNQFSASYKGEKRGVATLWTAIADLTNRVYYFFPRHEKHPIRIPFQS